MATSGRQMALARWELENNIEEINVDELYKYNQKQQQDMLAAKPWEKE